MRLKKIIIVVVVIMASIFLTACANVKKIIRDTLLESTEEKEVISWEEDVNQKYEAAIRTDDLQLLVESLEDGADINDLNGSSPVYNALLSRNLELAKYLIEHGSNPNWETDDGETLLMASLRCTVKTHKRDMVLKTLLEYGADITYVNKDGISAFDYAVSDSYVPIETLQLLLDAGAKVSQNTLPAAFEAGRELKEIDFLVRELEKAGTDFGVPEIVEAAVKKDKQKVKNLLTKKLTDEEINYVVIFMTAYGDRSVVDAFKKKGLNFGLIGGCTKIYQTSFLYKYALKAGNKEMVQYFQEVGDLDFGKAEGEGGDFPLIYALEGDQCELVKYLIEAGVDIHLESYEGQNMRAAVENDSPEMMELLRLGGYVMEEEILCSVYEDAISYSNKEALNYLVEHGYDINAGRDSSVPADSVCQGDMETVRYVVEHGGIIDGSRGSGLMLIFCIQENETEKVLYLIEHGADINKTSDGTCLYYAIKNGNLELVTALVEHGADVNEECFGFYALERGAASREMVRVLIEAGADVNMQNEEYQGTALMSAAYCGNVEGVKMLLEAGADPELKNDEGKTALDKAKEGNNPKCAKLLEEAMSGNFTK